MCRALQPYKIQRSTYKIKKFPMFQQSTKGLTRFECFVVPTLTSRPRDKINTHHKSTTTVSRHARLAANDLRASTNSM